jgi:hypothetical protein
MDRSSSIFATRLRHALLVAAGVPVACAGSAPDEVAIPVAGSASAGAALTATPPVASVTENPPEKDPADSTWRTAEGLLCMPPASTNRSSPAVEGSSCGSYPSSSVQTSSAGCSPCTYRFDEKASLAEARKRGRACCYEMERHYVRRGRPLRSSRGASVVAHLRAHAGWAHSLAVSAPHEAASQAWLADARLEHASAAELTRLALELAGLGAPARLVRASLEAAAQEVTHARLCLGLAEAYGGDQGALGFGALELGASRPLARKAVELAERLLHDGCVGESVAALVAWASAADARARGEADVARTLEVIASDEAEHAALSMAALAFCLERASPRERAAILGAVERALADQAPRPEACVAAGVPGRLTASELAQAAAEAHHEVVAPALRRLLGVGTGRRLVA